MEPRDGLGCPSTVSEKVTADLVVASDDDDEAFGERYASDFESLVRLAVLLVDSSAAAEDVVTEVFAKLYAPFDTVVSPRGWLRAAVTNESQRTAAVGNRSPLRAPTRQRRRAPDSWMRCTRRTSRTGRRSTATPVLCHRLAAATPRLHGNPNPESSHTSDTPALAPTSKSTRSSVSQSDPRSSHQRNGPQPDPRSSHRSTTSEPSARPGPHHGRGSVERSCCADVDCRMAATSPRRLPTQVR